MDASDWEDIHVITGALKLFFRELPEPLVPFGFFTDIVETVSELPSSGLTVSLALICTFNIKIMGWAQ